MLEPRPGHTLPTHAQWVVSWCRVWEQQKLLLCVPAWLLINLVWMDALILDLWALGLTELWMYEVQLRKIPVACKLWSLQAAEMVNC